MAEDQEKHLTIGEFMRWADDDRAWKQTMSSTLQAHDRDIAVLKDRDNRTTKTAASWGAGLGGLVTLAGMMIEYFRKG